MTLKNITIVKIGGNVVDDPEALRRFAADFARLQGRRILVHGGGKEATRMSQALGIPTTMIDGRRVTDAATLDVVTMVYSGLVNKRIVALLQSLGCNAAGFCGADAGLVRATRRPPRDGVDFGFVGDLDPMGVDILTLSWLLESGITPAFSAIMSDGEGQLLNCNADSVASCLAKACARVAETHLVYCFEMPGVMRDINDPRSVIRSITPERYSYLRSRGIVSKGMIPKIDGSISAVEAGVRTVTIKHASDLLEQSGTVITL